MTNYADMDEPLRFSEEEYVQAYRLIETPAMAATLAREMSAPRDPEDAGSAWQLSPDVLDLLSLVSASCAQRVQAILHLTDEEAARRRDAARARFLVSEG